MVILTMDVLKYGFGIDLTREKSQRFGTEP